MPALSPVPAHSEPPSRTRLDPLVVGYDGSDGANAAAAFALWLTGKTGCRTTLLHVGPAPDAAGSPALAAAAGEYVVEYADEWHRRLENLREYAPEDAMLDCRVAVGNPAGALIAAAAEIGAALILIGSHGVGQVRGALLGSVSSQVIAHAPCSVLIFRERSAREPASHTRTIVVGVDGSPSSLDALERAQALAVPLDARLLLVHAYDPHIPLAVMTTDAIRNELSRHGRSVLGEARAAVTAPVEVEEQLVEGQPRAELLAACERQAPALLAVGSRGLGGFRQLLVGSTSRCAANHAACPVLIARAR
jgi:nucleotide-binding universal stress UspA family protein